MSDERCSDVRYRIGLETNTLSKPQILISISLEFSLPEIVVPLMNIFSDGEGFAVLIVNYDKYGISPSIILNTVFFVSKVKSTPFSCWYSPILVIGHSMMVL